MLQEFQDYTLKFLKENSIPHRVVETHTVDGRRVMDEIYVSFLPEELENKGFYLAQWSEEDDLSRIYQPSIPMSKEIGHSSRKYGYIPDGLLD